MRLKGMASDMRLFSFQIGAVGDRTSIADPASLRSHPRTGTARIGLDGGLWDLEPGRHLTIGRSDDNDVSVLIPFVSRRHATVASVNALVEFRDHSSVGSYLRAGGGNELKVFRRAVVLTGRGTIALGAPHGSPGVPILQFRVDG